MGCPRAGAPSALAAVLAAGLAVSGCVQSFPTPTVERVVLAFETQRPPDVSAPGTQLQLSVIDAMSGGPLRCEDVTVLPRGLQRYVYGDDLVSRTARRFELWTPSSDGLFRLDRPTGVNDKAANPWRAFLVHVTESSTYGYLLEGCTCIRTSTNTHSDPLLDAEVRGRCALVGTSTQAPTPLVMRSVFPPSAVLRPCGMPEPVVIAGRPNTLARRACVDAVSCAEGADPDCVPCSGDDCLDYWTRAGGALLERFVEPGVEHPTRLATWSLDLSARSTCTELGLETWMPGRAGRLTTPLTCVRPMQAVEREAQELPLDVVKGRVMIPEHRLGGGVLVAAEVGLLLEERAGVPLTYVQAAAGPSGWLVRPAGLPLVPARETLLDFVAFPRATTDGAEVLLAIATSSTATTGPILRIVRPATPAAPPVVLSVAAPCTPRPGCGLTRCERTGRGLGAQLSRGDLDGDGVTDLLLGERGGRTLLRYTGSLTSSTGLAATCTCEPVGVELGSFGVAQLGGPDPTSASLPDLAIGGEDLRLGYGAAAMCSAAPPPRLWRAASEVLGRARVSRADVDDLLVMERNEPPPGSSDVTASMRVVFGGDWDLTQLRLQSPALWEPATLLLDVGWPSVSADGGELRPEVHAGDFNGDGALDLLTNAVDSRQGDGRIWLGGLRRGVMEQRESGPGELPFAVRVCSGLPYEGLLVGDMDADGVSDVVALCSRTNLRGTTLVWYRSSAR